MELVNVTNGQIEIQQEALNKLKSFNEYVSTFPASSVILNSIALAAVVLSTEPTTIFVSTSLPLVPTLVFVIVGRPVFILVIVGTLNGLILPITLTVTLIAAYKKRVVGAYKHPLWMTIFGVIVVVLTTYMCGMTLLYQIPKLMGIA